MNAKMNIKSRRIQFASLALVALMVLCSVPYLAQESEAAAEITAADWKDYETGIYFDLDNECYYVDNAVHISDLNTAIPLPTSDFDKFYAYSLNYHELARPGGGYFVYGPSKTNLSAGDSFTKIAGLFGDDHNVVLTIEAGEVIYFLVLIYDAPAPAAGEMTAADYRTDDGYYVSDGKFVSNMPERAVHITDLSATIPALEGFTNFTAAPLSYNEDKGVYQIDPFNRVNLSEGMTFEAIADLFENDSGFVAVYMKVGDVWHRCVVTYDAPVVDDVISYDVTGTLTAGAIAAKAVKSADATADLENAMFNVIAHYSDGKFISVYVPAAAAEDGSLSLSNMGVSTLGLVDVMVGVIGGVPSDEPTEYFGETVLKATA